MSFIERLKSYNALMIRQKMEVAELFGIESKNKYSIQTEAGEEVGFAAEQSKGILGFLARQFLGHYRTFEIQIVDGAGNLEIRAVHPFRFFFQRLEVADAAGANLGAIQQRFAFFSKKFDYQGPDGNILFTVNSGLFKIWTFPIQKDGRDVALITKKWTGALAEVFTDKDNFRVEFKDPSLTERERALIVASAFYVDLIYFGRKAS